VIASLKRHYWVDLLRALADEDITVLQTKMTVLVAIYTLSRLWSFVNPVTLVQSCRKVLPDTDDDFQGFPGEEINKSEILDMVCAKRISENSDDDNVKE
jgi:hypothetical protein